MDNPTSLLTPTHDVPTTQVTSDEANATNLSFNHTQALQTVQEAEVCCMILV